MKKSLRYDDLRDLTDRLGYNILLLYQDFSDLMLLLNIAVPRIQRSSRYNDLPDIMFVSDITIFLMLCSPRT